MTIENNKYTHAGHLFRGILNDFKRRPEDAAKELELPLNLIEDIIANRSPLTDDIVNKACEIWPVSPRDFASIYNDAPNGVLVMRAQQSELTSRVMIRNQKEYYEYRDTACSRVSSFRPEWIKELHVVDDNKAENATIEWNNGHFMHQFTYFIGPVNFYYYDEQGVKQVAIMNTGDSMYISPFVPHTFATRRNPDNIQGLILALTFGNNLLGDSQHELNAISAELSENYCLDVSNPYVMTGALIHYHMDCLSMTKEELARRAKLDLPTLDQQLEGKVDNFDYSCLNAIATAMNINLRDLLGHENQLLPVIVTYKNDSMSWNTAGDNFNYSFRELASTKLVPSAKSIEISVNATPRTFKGNLRVGLHQYIYNVGNTDVAIYWLHEGNVLSEIIHPGDSLYLKPFVIHDFTAEQGLLLSLRIQSKISGDSVRELSYIGKQHIKRIVAEDRQWFNTEDKSNT